MIIPINPKKLSGNWKDGYALDVHSIKSVYLGEDEYGHSSYKTERSQIGEALYQLKYKSDKSEIGGISETVCDFILSKWQNVKDLNFILPVPPSNPYRRFQPVLEIAKSVSLALKKPLSENDLVKVKTTAQLKNIYDYEERINVLENVFAVKTANLAGKNLLLFDDLYRSGATLKVITDVLYNQGRANSVYVLALTRTRKNL